MPPRRSHTKSRSGCGRCKKRRIKCDEVHPSCGNCIKHGIECNFALPSPPPTLMPQASASWSPLPPATVVPHPRAMVPPHARLPEAIRNVLQGTYEPTVVPGCSLMSIVPPEPHHHGGHNGQPQPLGVAAHPHAYPGPPMAADTQWPSPTELNLVNLELMHHFTTEVYKTISDYERLPSDVEYVWQKTVPKIAFQNEFCMHAVLAVTSLHMHFLETVDKRGSGGSVSDETEGAASTRRAKRNWLFIAAQHHDKAISQMNAALSTLSGENCHALFISSSLVVMYAMGVQSLEMIMAIQGTHMHYSPPYPSLPASSGLHPENSINWLSLTRGMHTILREVSHWVEKGPLSPLLKQGHSPINSVPKPYYTEAEIAAGTAISALFELCTPSPKTPFPEELHDTEVSTLYYSAIHKLQKIFVQITSANNGSTPGSCGIGGVWISALFAWPIAIKEKFVELLEVGRPRALVILAHYFAIMRCADKLWWLRGRAKWEVLRIKNEVGEGWEEWMRWPLSRVTDT